MYYCITTRRLYCYIITLLRIIILQQEDDIIILYYYVLLYYNKKTILLYYYITTYYFITTRRLYYYIIILICASSHPSDGAEFSLSLSPCVASSSSTRSKDNWLICCLRLNFLSFSFPFFSPSSLFPTCVYYTPDNLKTTSLDIHTEQNINKKIKSNSVQYRR